VLLSSFVSWARLLRADVERLNDAGNRAATRR